jgi:hypothetical protein
MPSDARDLELLRREFSAEDGTFLLQLRIDLHWDRQAFSRLEQAMRRVCARLESRDHLERWLAEGYWYLSDFVPSHTSHPNSPGQGPPNITRLRSSAYGTCSTGSSPEDPSTRKATSGPTFDARVSPQPRQPAPPYPLTKFGPDPKLTPWQRLKVDPLWSPGVAEGICDYCG